MERHLLVRRGRSLGGEGYGAGYGAGLSGRPADGRSGHDAGVGFAVDVRRRRTAHFGLGGRGRWRAVVRAGRRGRRGRRARHGHLLGVAVLLVRRGVGRLRARVSPHTRLRSQVTRLGRVRRRSTVRVSSSCQLR